MAARGASAAALVVVALHLLPPWASSAALAGCLLLVVLATGATALGFSGTRRRLFGGLTLGVLAGAVSQMALAINVARGGPSTFLFPGLVVFLAVAHPAIVVGLLGALDLGHRPAHVDEALDALLLVAAALVVALLLPYGPLAAADLTTLLPATADRYAFLYWRGVTVVELFLLALLIVWRGETLGPRSGLGLGVATVAFAVGNAIYARALLLPGAAAATRADPFWLAAVVGITLALPVPPTTAVADAAAPSPHETSRRPVSLRGGSLITAILVCSASALVLGYGDVRRPGLALAVACFGALGALRMTLAFRAQREETRGLASDVEAGREMSAALEQRVAARTAELAEAERVLQRLWVLGHHITGELHPARVLQRFVEAVMDVARADGGTVGLLSEDGTIRVAAALGVVAPMQGMSLPVEQSALGRVVRSGAPWSCDDLLAMPEVLNDAARRRLAEEGEALRAILVVPIKRRGETIGALSLGTVEPRNFTALEVGRIESLTDMLSVALANAELVENLRQAEWRFRTLFRAAPDAVLTVLQSGRIREANDCVRDIVGLDPIRVVGRSIGDLVQPDDRARLEETLRSALAGRPSRVEVRCLRQLPPANGIANPGQEERLVAFAASRLPEADPPTVLVVGRDVTAEREMRSRLLETERLAAVGELVAGVAHEVNNPLSSISAFAQLLLRDGGLSSSQQESVEVIRSETMRASQVVRDLLAFARRSDPQREAVELNAVVERTLRLHAYQLASSNVRVELDMLADLPTVLGDGRQLQQVVLNLVTNSIQALAGARAQGDAGEGGVLRVATRTARSPSGSDVVELEIADSGPGIPAEARARIFEPFFTTKPEGEGTGLGLSVSYGIVTAHGGTIVLADSSPRGTRFVVTLPAAAPAAAADTEPLPGVVTPRSPLAGIRLLFVDDEPALRSGMEAFGRLRGFSVVTAEEGAAALEAVQHTAFDAVVCDLRMPGMSGPQFHAALLRERPGLARRTVFITGDVVGTSARPMQVSRQPTLAKPFTFERLEEELVAILRN